jgi:hypothetical protein
MRRALVLGLILAGCASTTPTVSTDAVATRRQQAHACRDRLPTGYQYEVDRFGTVRVSGLTPGHQLAGTTPFYDCVFGAGQWKDSATTTPPPPRTPAPAAAPALNPPPSRTAQRLQELDALRQQKLITDDEYQATRKRILEGL